MDELSKVLKVLLKRVPYEIFLKDEVNSIALDTELFDKAVNSYFKNLSDTEVHYMLRGLSGILENYIDVFDGRKKKIITVFDAIFYFANAILVRRNNEVMFRFNKALRWRITTFDISEDIFVTAFLAQKDLKQGVKSKYFAWQPVIRHNNIQLQNITRRGMAENHFHLWGSVPYFHLSWIHLMNNLTDMEAIHSSYIIDQNLRTHYHVYAQEQQEVKKIRDCCMHAALIRLFLFSRLTGNRISLGEYYVEWTCLLPWIRQQIGEINGEAVRNALPERNEHSAMEFLQNLEIVLGDNSLERFYPLLRKLLNQETDFSFVNDIDHDENVSIQNILCTLFRQRKQIRLSDVEYLIEDKETVDKLWEEATYNRVVFFLEHMDAYERHVDQVQDVIDGFLYSTINRGYDYALDAEDFKTFQGDSVYYILSGERWLQYQMFRKIANGDQDFSSHIYNLFYAYLIIKEHIRGELVQSNKKVGFENFQIYQSRNGYFSGGDFLDSLKVRMAVISCIQQNVRLLELRITPARTAKENHDYIKFLDDAIDQEKKLQEKYFYVFHFIKQKDEPISEGYSGCRHQKLRKTVENQAQAILEFRRKYPDVARRVLGIDAASMEIGCRPEVFAQIFRTLQNDVVRIYTGGNTDIIPQLQATYHVGEDFLDVVDGVRAIDEAILFLGLGCGDRLGHALALGISVKDWYQSKQHNISLSRQDYLDNIVWLYQAIVRYRIDDLDNLKNHLEKEFQRFFDKIYRKNMDARFIQKILERLGKDYEGYLLDFNIQTYYDSWQLRGDSPELYKKGYYEPLRFDYSEFDTYAVNNVFPEEPDVRKMPEPGILYYYYHFDQMVRAEGAKEYNTDVSDEYVRGVGLVQRAMQNEIAARGIAIETNPSSNYKIGTIRTYDEHPLIRFYNNGLTFNYDELRQSSQIWVSINTDDQGVFSTSLENEYALMARALEKKKDEDGRPIYQKTMIYEWLDKIRVMGLDQSFGNSRNDRMKTKSYELDISDPMEEILSEK